MRRVLASGYTPGIRLTPASPTTTMERFLPWFVERCSGTP
jgi:hypothetical protein